MTTAPSKTIEILADTKPFGLGSWLGMIVGVAFGLTFAASGFVMVLSAVHLLSNGDYSTTDTDPESVENPYVVLLMGVVFIAAGLIAAFATVWDVGRKSWLIQPAERLLHFRAKWPFWQVSLVYPFDDIKDIRVGTRKDEDGISYYPELAGRFWFKNPGISDPGQRAGPEIVVETIRNALLDAGWRPSP